MARSDLGVPVPRRGNTEGVGLGNRFAHQVDQGVVDARVFDASRGEKILHVALLVIILAMPERLNKKLPRYLDSERAFRVSCGDSIALSMNRPSVDFNDTPAVPLWLLSSASISMLVALYLIFIWVSTEATMGIIQRIFYFHVPAATVSFWAVFTGGVASLLYLK